MQIDYHSYIQFLPENTSNPAAYCLLGWPSVSAYIDEKSLTLMLGMMRMKTPCIFKKVFIFWMVDIMNSPAKPSGPTGYFMIACKKYGLIDDVSDYGRYWETKVSLEIPM